MSNAQEVVSSLLSQVASLVKKMTDDEWKRLVAGEITIDLVKREESKKTTASRNKDNSLGEREIKALVSRLRATDEREEGLVLLDEFSLTKPSLELIARYIDVPVSQRDNMETLREKIIEATIGYRLRSMVIQGRTDQHFSRSRDSVETKAT